MNHKETLAQLKEEIRKFYVDHQNILEVLMIGYLLKGHILVEGPPGTGKTSLAKIMCRKLAKNFRRIQFTADLLPQDIVGSNVYLDKEFKFFPGPIFADFILADEINRASPRAQSALLEAMEEGQVTIDGQTRKLSNEFFLIATQNPQDHEGTFPLPEVQLDRFLICLNTEHGDRNADQLILKMELGRVFAQEFEKLQTISLDREKIKAEIDQVRVDESLQKYIVDLLAKFRNHAFIQYGPSIRAGIGLARCARAMAYLQSRDFVTPDDIKRMVPYVFSHRLRLSSEAMIQQKNKSDCMKVIISEVPFPA